MTDRPTCGSCPHRVRYRDSYGCARETPRGVIVGDTVLAAAPYVPPDYPGCQHHPHMGRWLASREEPAAPPMPADQLAELEQWREAFVWCPDHMGGWLLLVSSTSTELARIPRSTGGEWTSGRTWLYPSEAMRAAEAELGLPKCRVKGEP